MAIFASTLARWAKELGAFLHFAFFLYDGTLSPPWRTLSTPAGHEENQPAEAADNLPTEMHNAAQRGEVRTVTNWLDEGGQLTASTATMHGTLLHAAAQGGRLEVVDLLLTRGCFARTHGR